MAHLEKERTYGCGAYKSNGARNRRKREREEGIIKEVRFSALSPVILSLSGPLLGIVVGAAAGSIIVVFLIIVALKLRYRRRPDKDDKDSQHDDGGMATLTAAPCNDKTLQPLSSDSVESFEKDPDIIPHATGIHSFKCYGERLNWRLNGFLFTS